MGLRQRSRGIDRKSGVTVMRDPVRRFSVRGGLVCAATAGALLFSAAALAQDAAPPPASAPPVQLAPAKKPGALEAIGRWFDQNTATFRSHLRSAKERMDVLGDKAAANNRQLADTAAEVGKGAVEVTRGAVDAVAKLPTTRIMSGHERCERAPNGAPDCLAAADALCRKHGFASGKSVDFTSAEECPPRIFLAGRDSESQCRIVTFISRAMCQ
jgi:hypothetical protein